MVRIAISQAAFEAIAKTLPVGSVGTSLFALAELRWVKVEEGMTSSRAPTAEDLKAKRERTIFARFSSAARPDMDLATVQSCRPRAPDIACSTASGERLAFELAELCPPEVAKAVGDDLKAGGGATFTWTTDPTRRVLLKKLRACYTCDELGMAKLRHAAATGHH
jgi:hypothetical protein